MWSQICGKKAKIVPKVTQKKKFGNFGLSWGKFWPLRTLGRKLHMFLNILECRVENKNNCLGKTGLKMWSQKFTRRVVLSPESAKDFKCFHVFLFLNFLVFALFSKCSFVDTQDIFSLN